LSIGGSEMSPRCIIYNYMAHCTVNTSQTNR